MKNNLPTKEEVTEFLKESNAIEGVFGVGPFLDAKKAWDFLIAQPVLTKAVILETHRILMKNRPIEEKEKGFFRKVPVWIGGREGLNFLKIPEAIDEWLLDVETSLKIPGKEGEHFKLDHIGYEKIHPFVDGNGRTGRMFMNWERVKVGLPILIIHEGEEQLAYYQWFK
jgi:Fic family protein